VRSAEGATLNSHGRQAVVTIHVKCREARRAGIEIQELNEMPHCGARNSLLSCYPTALRPGLLNVAPAALYDLKSSNHNADLSLTEI